MFHIKKIIIKALLICATLTTPYALMAMEENPHSVNIDTYVSKLGDFYNIHKGWSYAYTEYEKEPEELKKIVNRLDLRSSPEEMFFYDGVIKNRPLVYDKLLLGCGNRVNLIGTQPRHSWSEEEREKAHLDHLHEGFDTVDLNFECNPSILMKVGDPEVDISQIFDGRRYKEVYFEGGPEFRSWFLAGDPFPCVAPDVQGETFIQTLRKHLLEITVEDAQIYELTSLSLPPEHEPGAKKMTYIRKGNKFLPVS